jgi:hypothetical protein
MRMSNIFTANLIIFHARKTNIIPPPKTTHKGKSNPKSIMVDITPNFPIFFHSYNNCVLSKLIKIINFGQNIQKSCTHFGLMCLSLIH